MFHFIINPTASSGGSSSVWNQILKHLNDIPYEAHFTTNKNSAPAIAREIENMNTEETIIVVGGDGTLNSVINGFKNPKKITLGYIPAGSGNDFGRSLNIQRTDSYIKKLLSGNKCINMDIGLLESHNQKHYFVVSSGIGCDADICTSDMTAKIKAFFNKLHIGSFSYVFSALSRIFLYKTPTADVYVDGQHLTVKNCYFSTIMNCCYEGGGIKFCPDADISDGILNLCIISRSNPLSLITLLPLGYSGKHIGKKGVTTLKGKKITIRLSEERPSHTDGEFFSKTNEITASLAYKIRFLITD